MRLPRLAIENHQFTLVIIFLLLALGTASFLTMPRSENPKISPPGSSIFVVYPGATPTDIEELVVDPLEQVLNEIDDIKRIDSNCEDGLGVISVEYHSGVDPDEKFSEFTEKINRIRNELPQDIFSIELFKWSIADVSILQLALISESESYAFMEQHAEKLKERLETTPGIRRVNLHAIPQRQVSVMLNLEKMAACKIALSQVAGAVQSANQNLPGGYVDVGSRRFNIQTSGAFASIDEIRNTVVHAGGGQIVRLKDIAKVHFDYEDEKYLARVNGRRSVFVTVQQKTGTNIFKVMNELERKIDEYRQELPSSIELKYVFNQRDSVAGYLNSFLRNLLQGLVLVGAVVLLAVSLRAAGIVILVIPFSLLMAVGFVDLSGYGLQQMTIAGLVIALGLLVDNAIVVTDNIARFMRLGHTRYEAAAQGTSQIGWAIVSATATTVLAFMPMMMIHNITGEFIRSMPLTVIYTLSASLLLSLTFTPYLSRKFLKPERSAKRRVRLWLERFIATHYRRAIHGALARPWLVVIIALFVLIGSMALFPLIGVSFFPKAEKPQFMINLTTPKGTSLGETDRITKIVEEYLLQRKEIDHIVANVGHGNPRIYYNVFPKQARSTVAQIFVQMKKTERDEFYQTIRDVRQFCDALPGAQIEVKEFEQGPYLDAPIVIRLLGDNLDDLKQLADRVEAIFRSTPGVVNISNPLATGKTDLSVRINREKAGMFGVPLAEIDRTVRMAMAGAVVGAYRDAQGKEHDIVLRLAPTGNQNIQDFSRVYLSSVTGAAVSLKNLASIEFKSTPMQIDHYNLERTAQIMADVSEGYLVEEVTKNIVAQIEKLDMPRGYRFSVGGEVEGREESFGGMYQAIIVALIGIFAVLVLQFKSFSQPFIVFSAIPLALIGAVLALLITGNSFSFTAFIGLTSLVGIVVNNAIILVDYTNQLRGQGVETQKAIMEACETRFIPIILTTATTVGGLLPLTLGGGSLWAPMGWTIIGGLLMSTWLTLIVVPVLYSMVTREGAREA